MKTIILNNDTLENRPVIRLGFPHDFMLKELVKTFPGCRWSKKIKSWYVPYEEDQLDKLISLMNRGEGEGSGSKVPAGY